MIRDPITGEHVLLGTTRSERPNEYLDGPESHCPFCPGNEERTPPELARTGTPQRWDVRVFTNKYPAISPPAGEHEVIVDSRDHDNEITEAGIAMWRERYRAALDRAPRSYPVLFKNAGALAGATIVHPHTQLIVIPRRPDRWEATHEGRACPWCSERERAHEEGTLVLESAHAAAFVRDASRFAWSLAIVPRACEASLDRASGQTWQMTAALAGDVVTSMKHRLGQRTSFNLLVYSDPHAPSGAFHWHLEIVPRLSTLAGFELSTGMFIRGAGAKESAARWRRMIAPPDGSL